MPNLNIAIILSCIVGAVTLFSIMGVVYFVAYRKSMNNMHTYGKAELEEKESHTCTVDLSQLFLIDCIGQGRYGTVWKASLHEKTIAVKVFSPENRFCWQTEVDFYKSLEFKSSPYVLRVSNYF